MISWYFMWPSVVLKQKKKIMAQPIEWGRFDNQIPLQGDIHCFGKNVTLIIVTRSDKKGFILQLFHFSDFENSQLSFQMIYASTFCTPKTSNMVEQPMEISRKYLSASYSYEYTKLYNRKGKKSLFVRPGHIQGKDEIEKTNCKLTCS